VLLGLGAAASRFAPISSAVKKSCSDPGFDDPGFDRPAAVERVQALAADYKEVP